MKISSTQEADNGGGNDTHENSIFKGGINPYRNQSQRGAFRRWIDRKPEKSLKDSLELM